MTLFVLAYLAGVLTIVSPCIRGPGLRRPGRCVRKSTPRMWCATKLSDGMGGNSRGLSQGVHESLGLSETGRSVLVSSMPLKGKVRREASRQDAGLG
jgi:hypothetical protein